MMEGALEPIYRLAELRALEAAAAAAPLMERAGHAIATLAMRMCGERGGRIVVLAGPGNNGGDGFVAARVLREHFHAVDVVFLGAAARLPADAAHAHAAWLAAGCTTLEEPPTGPVALVIDALFGVGITRPLAKPYAQLVEWANASGAPIVAVDIPTGLQTDTGIATAPAIRAHATLTFLGLKPGLLTVSGPELCGDVTVDSLGAAQDAVTTAGHCLRWPALAAALPPVLQRADRNVNKGSFGTLAVVGGAHGMVGAPLLAARAALALGAGKVVVGFLDPDHPPVDFVAPELMLREAVAALAGATALVVGPGLGTGSAAASVLRRAIAFNGPALFDADALNLLAGDEGARAQLRSRSAATLLTPHPAEAARLLQTDTTAITRDRLTAALTLARMFNAHVVVKGSGSILAHPDQTWDINTTGNPGLSSGGTGDVLSGLLGALLAQRVDAKTALRLGVCVHGAAADWLVAAGDGPVGLAASALAGAARTLINQAVAPRR
jgi:hydroxyethylthiazole kinase-like uncharacterized protein yjeF